MENLIICNSKKKNGHSTLLWLTSHSKLILKMYNNSNAQVNDIGGLHMT